MKRNEVSLRDFWANIKCKYSHYRSPRRRREKGAENKFEDIIAAKFLKLPKEPYLQIRE